MDYIRRFAKKAITKNSFVEADITEFLQDLVNSDKRNIIEDKALRFIKCQQAALVANGFEWSKLYPE